MSRAHSHSTLPRYTCCRGAGSLPFANYISPHLASCSAWGGGLRKTAPRRRAGSLHKAVQPAPPRQQGGVNRIPCPGQCGWSHRDKDDHLDHLALFTAGRMILLPIPCLTSSAVFYIPKDILVLTRQRSCRKRGPNSAAQLTLGSADPQRFFSTSAVGSPLRGVTSASGSPWAQGRLLHPPTPFCVRDQSPCGVWCLQRSWNQPLAGTEDDRS